MKLFAILGLTFTSLLTDESRAAAQWLCLAQDHQYSYSAISESKNAAIKFASQQCKMESSSPRACYSHRCEKQAIASESTPRGPNRSEMEQIEDALDRQVCSGTRSCARSRSNLTWEQREYMRQRLNEQERRGDRSPEDRLRFP